MDSTVIFTHEFEDDLRPFYSSVFVGSQSEMVVVVGTTRTYEQITIIDKVNWQEEGF